MDQFEYKHRRSYQDVSTVESQRNDLASEEFPEGSYGSNLLSESLGKSSPWRINNGKAHRPYGYENRTLHEDLPRDYPGEDSFGMAVPEVQDEP